MRSTAYQPPSTSRRLTCGSLRKLPVEFGQVGRDPPLNLPLNGVPAIEPRRQRPLHRRIHREKGVRDDLQTIERRVQASGPVATIHAAFICGSPAILLKPLTTKTGTPSSPAAKLAAVVAQAVVEKDLIDDQRKIELAAELRQFLGLPRLGEMAGRVIGMHQQRLRASAA